MNTSDDAKRIKNKEKAKTTLNFNTMIWNLRELKTQLATNSNCAALIVFTEVLGDSTISILSASIFLSHWLCVCLLVFFPPIYNQIACY